MAFNAAVMFGAPPVLMRSWRSLRPMFSHSSPCAAPVFACAYASFMYGITSDVI
jgi:hypothetical protein